MASWASRPQKEQTEDVLEGEAGRISGPNRAGLTGYGEHIMRGFTTCTVRQILVG